MSACTHGWPGCTACPVTIAAAHARGVREGLRRAMKAAEDAPANGGFLAIHSAIAAILPAQPERTGERYVCRNFDRWHLTEDEYGEPVDPNSCRVCGGMEHEHKPAAPPRPSKCDTTSGPCACGAWHDRPAADLGGAAPVSCEDCLGLGWVNFKRCHCNPKRERQG